MCFWRQDFVLWGLYKGRDLGPFRLEESLGQIFFVKKRWELSFVTLNCKRNAFGNKMEEHWFFSIQNHGSGGEEEGLMCLHFFLDGEKIFAL